MITQYELFQDEEKRPFLKEVKCLSTEPFRACNYRDVSRFLNENYALNQLGKEYCFLIGLDNASNILGVSIISIGTIDASMLSPREVFLTALLMNAASVIVAHNHP